MSRSKEMRKDVKVAWSKVSAPPSPQGTVGTAYQQLLRTSPVPPASISQNPLKILKQLGFRDYLICLGLGKWKCATLQLSELAKPLCEYGVIVPSPMSKRWGLKADCSGKSPRTNDNTGPPLFLVFAKESGSLDEQASDIRHLQRSAPLVMIVKRDAQHIEAWFSTRNLADFEQQEFKDRAYYLGASNEIFIPCTPYALPGGWNYQKKCRQEVIYWNPGAV